ncbi:thioredoxin domain-containing protein [Tamaricihabitans halophyticus]|uniref:thioredoxin domain-containing protein n=1 Tax=Tamaricihabitans halophyticus TaxID=1262583 RepID=UPI001404A225|nr:thioredoxin domain-containing protein [Tamaricihabitans halophyticus]
MNRLTESTSPYLLQHKDNPVDWQPWSPAALAEARARNVPILLSVGYAACHWCHVMAHESFEDPAIAEVLNEHFVNIKVDREERPDIDAVYMTATQAMTGHGGWPMTCFLTPDGEPFHCGTYYPPQPRPGMPSFRQLIAAVVDAWRERPAELAEAGGQLVEHLRAQTGPLTVAEVDGAVLDEAVAKLAADLDPVNGGFGTAPKFPPSMVLEALLRHYERTGSASALSTVEQTASAMARGGIYDQLAGGFARYSVDAEWIVPHFEKMLYDNALLLRCYAHLAVRTDSPLASRVTEQTAEFLCAELRTPEGGFASSLDADTEGVEGLTYVWTPDQLTEVLGESDGAWAAEVFGVTAQGTFEQGSSTLRLLTDPADSERLARVRAELLRARRERPQPQRDEKVIAAWNGLAITALAEAGAALDRPQWIAAAREAAELLIRVHYVDGRLLRGSRDGIAGQAGAVLEDYGCLSEALLTLHQVTGEPHWLALACELLDAAVELFAHESAAGAYYDTPADGEALVQRPADPGDNATPSGAAALANSLLTASLLVGAERADAYRSKATAALDRAGALVAKMPRFAGHWLTAAEAMHAGPVQVAVVGAAGDPGRAELWASAAAQVRSGGVALAGEPDAPGVPLLSQRPLVDGAAAAYVCRGYVCDRPVTTVAELHAALQPR